MKVRSLQRGPAGEVREVPNIDSTAVERVEWLWIDIEVEADSDERSQDAASLLALLAPLTLDAFAIHDALEDTDVPKFDDFAEHLLLVLHGLRDDLVATYEVDCFLTESVLVTVHHARSPSIDALWSRCQETPALASGSVGELLARLADVLTRRLLSVVNVFDVRIEELTDAALDAAPNLLESLTAVRADVGAIRRSVHPQREALDDIRRSESPLVDPVARRRLNDVLDVATRAGHDLDAARSALSETLEAYRGAEARKATEVSRVLTIYAAIMLPLSLVVGFFGMNFENLPLTTRSNGWIIVSIAMGAVATLSLGMFVGAGWMRRPSGRSAGRAIGKGLIEAALAPVELVGSVLEVSSEAASSATDRIFRRRHRDDEG